MPNMYKTHSILPMYLATTNINKVEMVLKTFKAKIPSRNDVSSKIFKHSSSVLSAPLTYMINLSLKTGIFPDRHKNDKVILLLKSSDRGNLNSHRAISILVTYNKSFEKNHNFCRTNNIEEK